MAVRVRSSIGDPVKRGAVGETTAERRSIDGEIRGGHRLAAAILLVMSGFMFGAPPAVALLVLGGLIR